MANHRKYPIVRREDKLVIQKLSTAVKRLKYTVERLPDDNISEGYVITLQRQLQALTRRVTEYQTLKRQLKRKYNER